MEEQQGASFGQALRLALRSARKSQADLARALNVDPGQISRWVNGKSVPHVHTVNAIELALGADLTQTFENSIPQCELYVSAPITGLDSARIAAHHDQVAKVVDAARSHVNRLFWPGEAIRDRGDLGAADLITERNMSVFAHCSALLYLQFDDIVRPSASLIELGLALGRRMKTTVITLKSVPLASMLEGFAGVANSIPFLPKARLYYVEAVDDACELIYRNGRDLLGLS